MIADSHIIDIDLFKSQNILFFLNIFLSRKKLNNFSDLIIYKHNILYKNFQKK